MRVEAVHQDQGQGRTERAASAANILRLEGQEGAVVEHLNDAFDSAPEAGRHSAVQDDHRDAAPAEHVLTELTHALGVDSLFGHRSDLRHGLDRSGDERCFRGQGSADDASVVSQEGVSVESVGGQEGPVETGVVQD